MIGQLKSIGMAALIVASIFSLLINTNSGNAEVVCVNKYNFTSFIPCSDQNAIVAPSGGNMTAANNMTNLGGAPIAPGENVTGSSISATFQGVTLPYTGFCPNGNWTSKVLDVRNGEFVEDAQYDSNYMHYHYVYCYVSGEHGDRGPFVNPKTGFYEPNSPTASSIPTTQAGGNMTVGAIVAGPPDNVTRWPNGTVAPHCVNANMTEHGPVCLDFTPPIAKPSNATGITLTATGMNKTTGMNATTNLCSTVFNGTTNCTSDIAMAQQGGSNSGCSISDKNCLELWAGAYLSHHPGLSPHQQAFWLCLSHDYYYEKCSLQPSKAVENTPPATTNQPGGSIQQPRTNSPLANDRYYEGLNWWGVCNNPLLRSYITQSCGVLVTPDKNALTSKGKVVLEGILCPKGPSIVSTLELFYGTIPQKLKNDLSLACGWH